MTNAIMTVQYSHDQIELVKRTIAKGATNDELALFMAQCQRTGLDPFSRQIYAIKRMERDRDSGNYIEKMTTQVSIDGFRLIAERSNKYAGQVGPFWCAADGNWRDVWLEKTPPSAAKVGVIRADFREVLWGVARFEAYAQTKKDGGLAGLWQKMPDVMLAKCAESLALRKAFPNELSGLYTSEEMAQAAPDAIDAHYQDMPQPAPVVQVEQPRPRAERQPTAEIVELAKRHIGKTASDKQLQLAAMLTTELFGADHRKDAAYMLTGKDSLKEMTSPILMALIDWCDPVEVEGGKYRASIESCGKAKALLAEIQSQS